MRIVVALLAALLLAGCGDKSAPPKAAPTPAATADDEAAIRKVFTDYNAALAGHDWQRSCSYLAPETAAKLRANVKKLGYNAIPKDCPRLLAAVYGAIESQPGQQHLFEKILKTAKIDGVDVTGDSAVIDWHATVKGNKTPVSQSVRKIDGEWKLVDVTN
jgi:hypothetical protein